MRHVRRVLLSVVAAVTLLPAVAASGGARPGGCDDPIAPAPIIALEECDTPERIVAKAVDVVPAPKQIAWQQQGVIAFTHFGMNTFTDREWGSGAEDPASFDPPGLDVEQWMRAYRDSGAKLVMLTVKHHDGFVLYPTRYTRHSIVASPWWNGDPSRDVLGRYVRAAREAGLRVGIYLSPSDGAEHPHDWHAGYVRDIRAKHEAGLPLSTEERVTLGDGDRAPGGHGRYGNGSAVVPRTIPTLVPGDDRADEVADGSLPSFSFAADDYNAFYLNQIYELLTQYGPIDEFWLDGANPWAEAGLTEDYDFASWFRLIERLSPGTVIDEGPRGFRWVGNEDGIARESEWSPTPYTADPENSYGQEAIIGGWPDGATAEDLGSREKITDPSVRYLSWMPAESDVSIRPGWFHHDDERPKPAAELVSLYQRSAGRNSLLLLNVPPDRSGRIDDADVAELRAFGDAIWHTYRRNLADGGGAPALTDGDPTTGWSPPGGATTGELEVQLGGRRTFDQVELGEDVTAGQRVERFAVDVRRGDRWVEIGSATTIGLRRLLVLSEPMEADRLRIRIQQSRGTPEIATLGLYRAVPPAAR
ncbi:alpha-L-fucosidase [Saccharopolyspora erythraea NRRL 2338]|uniref:alpha-L-fucosidase n=2 Tax=Saccharopolyspora erythraea TaxID=1836 RepID=A4F9B5_SACEN|nr:alpha-L-fucosidase [Saccharopolyspora erythraea]EQD86597.1 alpha-L-fucosidase [Saccharopolyspora erythraea D]PFG94428.1 alpha-L-fucosidase [Saccharopolyspora erythraea NRRL 2338]QRK91189.1 alpha-L-fucosidase [Saccharopolyspora erythraea]CAM00640.1 alpha-L-fucosidase [Saccharopolyspora erythraea NRRL 2338]